jgi:hypothetical protein
MKSIPCVAFALIASSPLTPSQQEKSAITAARILGEIPDGPLPPPEPPRPKFIVPAENVLASKSIQQGGRKITFQKIAPIALPPPVIAPPVDLTDPAIQTRIADFREETSDEEFLFVGASIFKLKGSTPLTLVNTWPQGQGEPIVFWSSADFGLLSGFSSYVGSDEITRSLLLMWSTSELETHYDLENELGPDGPKLPDLPPGKATFKIISGKPSPQTLTGIQSLHDLYNNEYDRLLTAYQGRERARLQQEAELKANPPRPKDIVINYWRIEAPAAQTGGAK